MSYRPFISSSFVRLCLGVLLALVTAFAEAQPLFPGPQGSASASVVGAVEGDFNQDDKPDFAAISFNGIIAVMLSRGDGTVEPTRETVIGGQPAGIAAGDLNGDGHLDIAITDRTNLSVHLLLGAGDGTFLPSDTYPTASRPALLTLADFDKNGTLDMAVANSGADSALDNRIQVWSGLGNGSFLSPVSYSVGTAPHVVMSADLNHDGFLDLVASNSNSSSISVLLNTETGGFLPAQQTSVTEGPGSLAAGDVNNDGFLDVVVVCNSNRVHLLRGKGDGTFYPRTGFLTGDQPSGVALADMNGDGRLDLLVTHNGTGFPGYPGTISIYIGSEFDVFVPFGDAGVGYIPGKVLVNDYNGDGFTDVAVASNTSRCVNFLMGNGDGTLQSRQDYRLLRAVSTLLVDDFNGDAIPDLFAGEQSPTSSAIGFLLLGEGNGSFRSVENLVMPPNSTAQAKGDFNGDGKTDIVATARTGNKIHVLLGSGSGTFQEKSSYAITAPGKVAVGDINGDSRIDLVVSNNDSALAYFLGNGDGTFQLSSTTERGFGVFVTLADVNRDGRQDLITAVWFLNTVSVFLGAGNGTFPTRYDYTTGTAPFAVTIGDWNGDTILDLGVADLNARSAGVLLGVGNGTFLPEVTYPVGDRPYTITHGDVNGDGWLDLVTGNDNGGVSVLLGSGDGTFQSRTEYATRATVNAFALQDFNQDGRLDIVAATVGINVIGFVSVLLQNAPDLAIVAGNIQLEDIAPSAASQSITLTFRPEDATPEFTRQVTINAASTFHLNDIPRKRYSIHIKGAKWLAVNMPVDVTASDITDLQAVLKAGDANGDNSVDVFDLDLLIQSFDSAPGDPNWNTDADLNSDNSIDVLDLDLLIRNFDSQGAE